MNTLEQYGWTGELAPTWLKLKHDVLQPARVIADFGTSLKVATPEVLRAELSGTLAHYSKQSEMPKVGDWVAVRISPSKHCVIESIIPRRSEVARRAAGNRTSKQVIAANVNIAFVLLALDNDFSIERLKRFLYQLSVNNIDPVIVLNKADKTDDLQSYIEQLKTFNLPIVVAAATTGEGVEEIRHLILPGKTAILLGSSGVGKSTLTNKLLGRDTQATQAVRESDSTGKHTTVHRELFQLPNGGMLIDSPGIRELQLWGTVEDLDDNYDDIIKLTSKCKYTTCRHNGERKCAIRDALNRGTLDTKRYEGYLKMKDELVGLGDKNIVKARLLNKRSRKSIRRQAADSLSDIHEEMY